MSMMGAGSQFKLLDAHCHVGQGLMNGMEVAALIEAMDRCYVQKAVVVPWDQAIAVHNREGNRFTHDLVKRYPDRFSAFCTVNPWFAAEALEELERCAALGMKGLKLHPVYQGYQLSDPFILPVIERAVALGMIIYIPTGIPVMSMPLQLTYIAERYPEGKFIQGHFGNTDFWIDSLPSVVHTPNIFVDTAYSMPSPLEQVVQLLGAERVIFSTDAPYLSLDNETEKLRALALPESDLRKIGYDNMYQLLEGAGIR